MLYHLNELKNTFLLPPHTASKVATVFLEPFKDPEDPTFQGLWQRFLTASNDLIERQTRTYEKPEFGIHFIEKNNKKYQITIETIQKKAFCHLIHFKKEKKISHQPPVLIIAPLSGHFATLLRDTVQAMLLDHDVYITDWIDAKFVPLDEGIFTLDTYVDYLLDFIRNLGKELHLIAVCQPSLPVLMAASLLAEYNEPCQPHSMILMGGPIDTRINPGKVNEFAQTYSFEWFQENIIVTVPTYKKGAGRKVCPGFMILGGFMALHPDRHQQAIWKYFEHLIEGDQESVEHHRHFYDEYRSVMDLPADYFLQSIKHAFQQYSLPLGKLLWRDIKIKPQAIQKTALMTVEGQLDDISCPGQTYAAHQLCTNLPSSKHHHYFQEGVGHYGIFNGRRWREKIQPEIAAFIAQHRS
ncbi:MAG: polyhydroxyalkanoate depolymerase [Proteobacteria bacterium]|nr:polyhydroxyalkanoate depolymerase [Pseudomonadota bacterium]